MKRKRATLFKLAERRAPVELYPDPIPFVEEWVKEARAQELKITAVAIHYVVEGKDGRLRPHTWMRNMAIAERIAFANVQIADAVDEWKT